MSLVHRTAMYIVLTQQNQKAYSRGRIEHSKHYGVHIKLLPFPEVP